MKNPNVHKLVKVERVIDETPTVRTLVVSDEILHDARPGQFCMVWIPGVCPTDVGLCILAKVLYFNDFETTAPAPDLFKRLNISMDIPKIPEASIAGFSRLMLPKFVARLGIHSSLCILIY